MIQNSFPTVSPKITKLWDFYGVRGHDMTRDTTTQQKRREEMRCETPHLCVFVVFDTTIIPLTILLTGSNEPSSPLKHTRTHAHRSRCIQHSTFTIPPFQGDPSCSGSPSSPHYILYTTACCINPTSLPCNQPSSVTVRETTGTNSVDSGYQCTDWFH